MSTRCHTLTGTFDPFNPSHEDVRLEDIAHALAMICRYGGACPGFYSVAEHAVRVARLVESLNPDVPEAALLALHHDSAEAYVHDIRRPIKHRLLIMGGGPHGHNCSFELVELSVLQAIAQALKLPECGGDDELLIKAADTALLVAEMRRFWPNAPEIDALQARTPLQPPDLRGSISMDWRSAKNAFLGEHLRLTAAIAAKGGAA